MVLARMTAEYRSRDSTDELVTKAVDWLLSRHHPRAIWLFGSASRYEMTEFSDLDIAVIFDSEEELKKARVAKIFSLSQSIHWPVDLLLMTHQHFLHRANVGGVCEIIKDEGICLYDSKA
ncbi:MAG: nucleotidyltransferase domain-containing protein [Betaproteobacteria bacterium]|nr:nucleotidyltransferase domain-containing protein [Betaproteobacteria bacterium]